MNDVTLTVFFKGIGMLAAIIGGIFIARWGFHLYKDGIGDKEDNIGFEVGAVKVKAKSVGSAVMATAFLWVYAGVLVSPNLDKSGDHTKVYSFVTPELSLNSEVLQAKTTNSEIRNNPEELKALFSKAVSSAAENSNAIRLDGFPATVQANSTATLTTETGKIFLTTKISALDKSATIAYEPIFENGVVVFQPAGVGLDLDKTKSSNSLQALPKSSTPER